MNGRKISDRRCVIVGGAYIADYDLIRSYLRADDYMIYCDSGLRHFGGLGAEPSLIIGDFDSHENPRMDVETIVLPVAKDDTDTVYASKQGVERGYSEFLLIGATGARLDHTLVNLYILTSLANRGCHGMIVDDYSEMELVCGGDDPAEVSDSYPFFSLIATEGPARGVTIRDAKFGLEDAEITQDYQYAVSNEVIPGRSAKISLREGRLLLIRDRQDLLT